MAGPGLYLITPAGERKAIAKGARGEGKGQEGVEHCSIDLVPVCLRGPRAGATGPGKNRTNSKSRGSPTRQETG